LTAAAASAISYLISRHHGNRLAGGSLRLLVQAHFLMGICSLPLVALLWPRTAPPPAAWLLPLVGSTACYLVGQAAVFALLKRLDASSVAPLLGLKIVVLASIVAFVLGHPLSTRQWVAVGVSIVAATFLRRAGAGVSARLLAGVLVACLFFSLSDICIVALIDGLQTPPPAEVTLGPALGRFRAGVLAMALTYALCGGIAACFVPGVSRRHAGGWGPAAQYAAAWLGGMVALYTCFGIVGVVFGNILQSTRGIMAVGLGAVLAHMGWHDLEQRVDRLSLVRRLVAAALMTAAIGIYAA
jgi:drug/metabolite transporter (DMT)-like permease